ncbi:interleukin-31 receptor subunit alpha-like [Denticeps clupeoides]|uniref:interleukin-31 receptor subunit alpha-like n=1 Tax=Denticeps clupeoides TaxID=299321 RepID=UPI0010A2C0E6|nr:interleukin-31 receptor subunit alpha-like [Denticeps clupeoides]XP_028830103.1 interleukin-31 receptor subunit alpha-like [Denticeps clupeoides]
MMDEEHSMVYSSSYVKPCTNYTVAVRCVDVLGTVWSDWAQTDTALSSLDVRSSGLSLWRRLFKTNETGYRTMHLMWKGPPSHCHAIDEYRLYVDTSLPEVLGPVHNHTIVLNESSHEIIVGAYKNGSELYNETLKIPATENDLPSVEELVALATDGKVFISWDAPALPMNDYMVIWFAEDYLYKWDQTQETNFSFLGAPFRLYTVIVTPVHINGLAGKESLLRVYAEEGAPARATGITVPELDATWATVEWDPVSAEECCGYVVNYTVLYKARDDPNHQGLPFVEERMVVESRELKPGEKVRVQLKNLQPNTTYTVYIMTSSIAGFNKSSLNTFTTKLFGQRFIIGLVLAAVGAVIFFILCLSGLILWMKTANRLIPDPGFSSLAEWPPKNWKKINLMNVWEASEPGDAILADHMCNMKEKQPLNMKPTENCMDVCDWTGSSQTTVSGEDTNCWSGMTDTTLLSKSSGYEDPPRNPPGSAMRESKQQAHITPHENFLHDARSNGLSKWHPGQEGMSTTETIMPYISLDTSEK